MPIHLSSRHGCKDDTRDTTSQTHAGNGHKYLRQLKPKYTWKTRVPVLANGISKQSTWRALFFLFSPTEDQPVLGRPQLPSYIRLRQVAALSPPGRALNLLCTTAFLDYTFWEEGEETGRRRTGGKRALQSTTTSCASQIPPTQELLA